MADQVDPLVLAIHEAMQSAPQDGEPYRQARAALAAVDAWWQRTWGDSLLADLRRLRRTARTRRLLSG